MEPLFTTANTCVVVVVSRYEKIGGALKDALSEAPTLRPREPTSLGQCKNSRAELSFPVYCATISTSLPLKISFEWRGGVWMGVVVHELERAQKSGDDEELRRVIEKLNSSVLAALPLPDRPPA